MAEVIHNNHIIQSRDEIIQSLLPQPLPKGEGLHIGAEEEIFFLNEKDLSLMTPHQSQAILGEFIEYSRRGTYEDQDGKLYSKKPPKGHSSIITNVRTNISGLSLESCSVIEIDTKPYDVGNETDLLYYLKSQREHVIDKAKEQGLIPSPFSSQPHIMPDDIRANLVNRKRLKAGFEFFSNHKSLDGMASMGLITSSQVSVEADPDEYDNQIRYAFMMQPLFYALCSSHNGYHYNQGRKNLIRPDVYLAYDDIGRKAERSGIPSFIFDYDKPVIESYADAALNTPMLFHYDKNNKIVNKQISFNELKAKHPELATQTNLNAAKSLLFYDIKVHNTPKGSGKRIELRSADAGPGNVDMAVLMTSACLGSKSRMADTRLALKQYGFLEDPDHDRKSIQLTRKMVSQDKLETKFGNKTLHDFAHTVKEIVHGAIPYKDNRYADSKGLDTLDIVVASGMTNTAYAEKYLTCQYDILKHIKSPMGQSGIAPAQYLLS